MIILTLTIILNALADGFRDSGKKIIAHICATLHIAAWMTLLYLNIDFQLTHVFFYILIRFAIFDLIWNITTGQKIFYIGDTSLYDKTWKWIAAKTGFPLNHMLFWAKFISLLVGLSLLVN